MQNVNLHNGPANGTVLAVDPPWPRSWVTTADGDVYWVQEGTTDAYWADPALLDTFDPTPSVPGIAGPIGPPGPVGATGAAGPAGPIGPQGDLGPQGAQGPAGPAGPAGPQGVPGPRGITPRGEWAGPTNYVVDDLITFGGEAYIALVPNAGFNPSTNPTKWARYIAKGDLGPVGPPGPIGPAGPIGPDGPVGPAGPTSQRYQTVFVTGNLAPNASEQSAIPLARGYRLYSVSFDRPARLRLYTMAGKQAADFARGLGVDPSGDHGVVFEFVAAAGILSADLSPLVDGVILDALVLAAPATIQNRDAGASAVTVTLDWLKTE